MTELRIRLEHVRAARLCSAGMRVWLTHHGFDVRTFIREGIPAAELEATGDGFALYVAAIARERETG